MGNSDVKQIYIKNGIISPIKHIYIRLQLFAGLKEDTNKLNEEDTNKLNKEIQKNCDRITIKFINRLILGHLITGRKDLFTKKFVITDDFKKDALDLFRNY